MSALINSGIIIFLNPIVIFLYLFYRLDASTAFVQVGTNSYRILLGPYIHLCLIIGVLYLSCMYLFSLTTGGANTFIDVLKPRSFYATVFAGLTALLILSLYSAKAGVEFNIFAFFYFPILGAGAIALGVLIFMWLFDNAPATNITSPLTLWPSIFLACFNPFLVWFYLLTLKQGEPPLEGVEALMTLLITNLVIYGILALGHFIVFKVIGRSFTASEFFGVGASMIYLLPFIIGVIYAAYQMLLVYGNVPAKLVGVLTPVSHVILIAGVAIMMMSYIRYLRQIPF